MKTLDAEAVARFRRDGFYFPIRVLSPEEAAGYRACLEAVERAHGGALGGELRHKSHLLFTWLNELIRHPRIVDAVEDILGPNLFC
jgi:non-haem Fe2+, alpha-ketoglutarate-dependent halogenase